jgi:hypothetical protein
VAQLVEHLANKHEALSSNPITAKAYPHMHAHTHIHTPLIMYVPIPQNRTQLKYSIYNHFIINHQVYL